MDHNKQNQWTGNNKNKKQQTIKYKYVELQVITHIRVSDDYKTQHSL